MSCPNSTLTLPSPERTEKQSRLVKDTHPSRHGRGLESLGPSACDLDLRLGHAGAMDSVQGVDRAVLLKPADKAIVNQ